jgi:hypothetical protein
MGPVFHITHWKAGSQWVRGVLGRLVGPRLHGREGIESPIRKDGVYSPVYMTVEQFEQALGEVNVPHRRFVVIRDLRDTLVSWYFSLLVSHPTGGGGWEDGGDFVSDFRRRLAEMGKDEGLQYLIQGRLLGMMRIQRQWLLKAGEAGVGGGGGEDLLVRYEEMIDDEQGAFARIVRHCRLDVSEEQVREAVAAESFQVQSGRRPGEEDVGHHYRKGVRGDWRNHFSEETKRVFKERFGRHLIHAGYEQDMEW